MYIVELSLYKIPMAVKAPADDCDRPNHADCGCENGDWEIKSGFKNKIKNHSEIILKYKKIYDITFSLFFFFWMSLFPCRRSRWWWWWIVQDVGYRGGGVVAHYRRHIDNNNKRSFSFNSSEILQKRICIRERTLSSTPPFSLKKNGD